MAKKGKPTWMTNEIKKEIRKLNSRLKSIYSTFGYGNEYATSLRNEISSYVPLSKTGTLSTAAAKYDASTISDTMAMLRGEIETVTDIKNDAKTRLSGIYKQRSQKYKTAEEEITEAAIVEQVNATAFLEQNTAEDFEKFYELWKNKDAGKIYDKALETKLDEYFRVGQKHIWSDAEYAEAFSGLKEFTKLLEAF